MMPLIMLLLYGCVYLISIERYVMNTVNFNISGIKQNIIANEEKKKKYGARYEINRSLDNIPIFDDN